MHTPFQLLADQVARMNAEVGRLMARLDRLERVPADRSIQLRATLVAQDMATIVAQVKDPALFGTIEGRKIIVRTMRSQGWPVARIARALGISERSTKRAARMPNDPSSATRPTGAEKHQ